MFQARASAGQWPVRIGHLQLRPWPGQDPTSAARALAAGPARGARDATGRPKGESQRGSSPSAGLEPHADVSRPGPLCWPCLMGLGYAVACTPPLPLGRPGPVTPTTAPPAGQAATGEAGPRPTTARTRLARVDWISDRHRPRGTGPVKRGATDSDARRASGRDGLQVKTGYGTTPARRPRPRGKEVVPWRARRAAQVPTSGPISGPLRLPASRQRRDRP